MPRCKTNIEKGIGYIKEQNAPIYFNSATYVELIQKNKEIDQLKTIIAKLDGSQEDETIKKYLKEGDYVEAAILLEKSLQLDTNKLSEDSQKLFDKEIALISTTSLYSFDDSINIIEDKLKKYSNVNINIIRLTLAYADILLLYGKLKDAVEKFKSIELLCEYKIHFLSYDNNTKLQKIGITKSDGCQLNNVHSFTLEDKKNSFNFTVSIQTLFFSNYGQANCYSSFGAYKIAYNLYFESLKYAVILSDDKLINRSKLALAYMLYAQGYYDEAIKLYKDIDCNTIDSMEKYHILAHIYIHKNDEYNIIETIENYKKIYNDIRNNSLNNEIIKGMYYETMASYYQFINNFDKAEVNFLKSIEHHKNNKQLSAMCDVYIQLAHLYYTNNKAGNAKEYYKKAMELAREYTFLSTLSRATHNYALIINDANSSIRKFKEAMYLNNYINKTLSLATNLCMIADNYRRIKKFKKSKQYIENAYNIYKKENQTELMNYDAYYDILSLDKKKLKDYFYLLKISRNCNNCYKEYDAYMNLGTFYTKLGNTSIALKCLKRAEEKMFKCLICTDHDKFETYIYLSQIYLNSLKYKQFNITLERAKKFSKTKRSSIIIELFEMLLAIKMKNEKYIFIKAGNISLKFNLLDNQDIMIFFHELHPFIMESKKFNKAIIYADRYISTIANKKPRDITQTEAEILSYSCQWYANYTIITKDTKIWLKATVYLILISDFFKKHINGEEKNYFYAIMNYLYLATLFVVVGLYSDSLYIYQQIYNENFMTDDIWEEEPFLLNKKHYYSGMLNYAISLRENNQYDLAIEIFNKNIKLLKNTTNLEDLELSYSNLALTYVLINKENLALKNFVNALCIAKKEKNTFAIAHAYEYLGIIYKKLKDFSKSLKYFEKSIYSYKKNNNKEDVKRVEELKFSIVSK